MKSDQINELAAALAKAQAEMMPAIKDSANPFFKSKYADLAAVWDACRGPLTKHGLSVMQLMGKDGEQMVLVTTLAHSSGQWIESISPITPVKNDPQGIGSAMTYMRRYALAAIVGVYQDDDDGNAAVGNQRTAQKTSPAAKTQAPPVVSDAQTLGSYVIKFGKWKGQALEQIGLEELKGYVKYIHDEARKKGKPPSGDVSEFIRAVEGLEQEDMHGNFDV